MRDANPSLRMRRTHRPRQRTLGTGCRLGKLPIPSSSAGLVGAGSAPKPGRRRQAAEGATGASGTHPDRMVGMTRKNSKKSTSRDSWESRKLVGARLGLGQQAAAFRRRQQRYRKSHRPGCARDEKDVVPGV